ncbi:MAG TPA: hypothetical protein VJ945_08740 [Flavobacteriaceae bacterium]|nr:hypothetical protein [Flavobacteriaceae bacterium]
MFLRGFKEKSNQKYINKLLSARMAMVDARKIKSVGVILNFNEFIDFEAFRAYLKILGIKTNKVKIIAFIEDEKDINFHWETYFSPKDFGWKGKVNKIEIQTFIETEFDALISYYKKDTLEPNLVTAQSNANFKIGLSNDDQRLYDLIIDVNPDEFMLFKSELKKYLTVLNKL